MRAISVAAGISAEADGTDIGRLIDTQRYPLQAPGDRRWDEAVGSVRADLAADGCSVLPGFIRPELHATLRDQGEAIAPSAYSRVEIVNAYNIAVDDALPQDHPARIAMERGNAFVPRDVIPRDAVIHRLYADSVFQRFLAACFGLTELHELADPLAGLVLNVVAPGREHPWHFDTNEFTVSMVTREPTGGGEFEYCPQIRSATAENFDDVRAVLCGHGGDRVRRLTLRPGDLQLFQGRYSLHRVCRVTGEQARHTAIFAYTQQPGVIGSPERTRQLFGRMLPEHTAAVRTRVRTDELLD